MRITRMFATVLVGFLAIMFAFAAKSQDDKPRTVNPRVQIFPRFPNRAVPPVQIVPRVTLVPKRNSAALPTPSKMSVAEFEEHLFKFLQDRKYREFNWARDKRLRDTGPFLDGKYYGTHPAVRVYYSPEVIKWLAGGRRGVIPDGAMIVKEQYPAPAVRHEGKSDAELWESLESWTVMVKDSQGSQDGWFWSNPGKEQKVVDNHKDFSHPISGFGLYCIRCHASTKTPGQMPDSPANEFTFSSLRNIEGYPGEPILFRVDDSWRKPAEKPQDGLEFVRIGIEKDQRSDDKVTGAHPRCARSGTVTPCTAAANSDFLKFFDQVRAVERNDVAVLPPVTHDWVVKQRGGCQEFVTSNQCMTCHAGLMKPYGPTMFVPTGKDTEYGSEGWNISPYGEWRWTPMGLAGRDPIFLAQLESERTLLAKEFGDKPEKARRLSLVLEDTCLKCHGAMGRHQFHSDGDAGTGTFSLKMCEEVAKQQEHIGRGKAMYGALAREGISCMVCHRMQERPQPAHDKRPYLQFFLETSVTGNLHFGPPNEIYGPFKDNEITAYPMQHALGITPKHSSFIKSSRMCGSCHTVTLPAVDRPIKPEEMDELNDAQLVKEFAGFHHHVEQATYLEWLNSEYENEFRPNNPKAKSCQDCHMSRDLIDEKNGLALENLATRMAIIQDTTYPDAENLATHQELDVRIREKGFARHNFSGLNLFLLELFDQFDDVLGVPKEDYMTGSKLEIEHARQNFLQTARHKTADLELAADWSPGGELTARVTVTNKAGHRFPSGVGFRRAFIELLVVEPADGPETERILWSSGRTNSLGVIVDADGQPLSTESFEKDAAGKETFQPHHDVIRSSKQVQIYESLICNAKDRLTTSFLHGCHAVKDNRLLPKGWSKDGPDPALSGRYLEATHPAGRALDDPRYQDGSGSDVVTYQIPLPPTADPERLEVRATLFYQAIPPYFLRNLFQTAPDGPATKRLHFLLSHADLDNTPIKDWKLPIRSVAAKVAAK